MVESLDWHSAKAKEDLSRSFVKTALERAGYDIMNFGIESHNQQITEKLAGEYKFPVNRKLLAMPDLVVVDPSTKESWIIEVKYRGLDYINKSTKIQFKYHKVWDLHEFWPESILILVIRGAPFCFCVRVADMDIETDLSGGSKNAQGKEYEEWNFWGKYKQPKEVFPRLTEEIIDQALRDISFA